MKTFNYNFVATQIHTGNVDIEAETKEEADEIAQAMLDKCDAGEYDEDIQWDIQDSEYSCEELRQSKIKKEIANELAGEVTIHIFNASNVKDGWRYNTYKGSPDEDNDEPLDGGACTGRFRDALEMASDQADVLYKRGALTN